MFRTFKSDQRLIQTIGLPISLFNAPIIVTGNPEQDLMPADVLRSLVYITAPSSRSANQSQSQCLIIRLIRSILTVSQNRRAERAGLIGQVDPLVRSDFELTLFGSRSLHRADVPVVGGQLVRRGQAKGCLQIRVLRLPINDVAKFDAIAGVACRETDRLHTFRVFGFAFDFDSDPRWTIFDDANLCRTTDERARCSLFVFKIHVPGRPLPRVVSRYRQTDGRRQELSADLLIEDARHVAVSVYRDSIACVLK